MIEKEMQVSVQKFLKILWATLSLLVLIISLWIIFDCFRKTPDQQKLIMNYNSNTNLDYKVYLKPNKFYERSFMEKNKKYISSIIDYIDVDLNYMFNTTALSDTTYSYSVSAVISSDYDLNGVTAELWSKSYQLVAPKSLTKTSSSGFQIKENLKLDYNKYDSLATSFKEQYGIASDTNRFMFNASSKVLGLCSRLLEEYKIDTQLVYSNLYTRPLTEVRLQGYIGLNMKVTENGFGYIKLFDDVLNNLSVDSGSAGNMVNTFNYIEGVYAWAVVTKDSKNDLFKVNIRSRGPVINSVAEKYNGGGHKFASGARIHDEEQVDLLLKDLDLACLKYIEEEVAKNED